MSDNLNPQEILPPVPGNDPATSPEFTPLEDISGAEPAGESKGTPYTAEEILKGIYTVSLMGGKLTGRIRGKNEEAMFAAGFMGTGTAQILEAMDIGGALAEYGITKSAGVAAPLPAWLRLGVCGIGLGLGVSAGFGIVAAARVENEAARETQQ